MRVSKKQWLIITFSFFTFSVFPGIYAQNQSPVYGMIAFTSGDTTITKNNEKLRAKIGMKIEENDSISTRDGQIRIQIADAYICHIEKNTTVTFKKILENTNLKSYNIDLHKGQIFSRLIQDKTKASELTIKTPAVTAGVRGTDFMVSELTEDTDTEKSLLPEKPIPSGVYVSSGSVDVTAQQDTKIKKINLKSGEQATITPGELRKAIMDDFIAARMKILDELRIMKEYNCKLVEEQKEKNRKLLEDFK